MDLNLQGQKILVLGASSGFGMEVARRIAMEGGHPVLVARSEEKLKTFQDEFPDAEYVVADLFDRNGVGEMLKNVKKEELFGVLVNAGGPAAGSFPMDEMGEWDQAYDQVLRWKIDLLRRLLPVFEKKNYGRIVFVESVSVKEPLPGLVLSNVFRAGVQSLMKSIVNEMRGYDITLNLLAPGYHKTDRLENLMAGQSEETGMGISEIEEKFAFRTAMGTLGDPASFAQLAVWLLSPQNTYVTGQSIVIDGGMSQGL